MLEDGRIRQILTQMLNSLDKLDPVAASRQKYTIYTFLYFEKLMLNEIYGIKQSNDEINTYFKKLIGADYHTALSKLWFGISKEEDFDQLYTMQFSKQIEAIRANGEARNDPSWALYRNNYYHSGNKLSDCLKLIQDKFVDRRHALLLFDPKVFQELSQIIQDLEQTNDPQQIDLIRHFLLLEKSLFFESYPLLPRNTKSTYFFKILEGLHLDETEISPDKTPIYDFWIKYKATADMSQLLTTDMRDQSSANLNAYLRRYEQIDFKTALHYIRQHNLLQKEASYLTFDDHPKFRITFPPHEALAQELKTEASQAELKELTNLIEQILEYDMEAFIAKSHIDFDYAELQEEKKHQSAVDRVKLMFSSQSDTPSNSPPPKLIQKLNQFMSYEAKLDLLRSQGVNFTRKLRNYFDQYFKGIWHPLWSRLEPVVEDFTEEKSQKTVKIIRHFRTFIDGTPIEFFITRGRNYDRYHEDFIDINLVKFGEFKTSAFNETDMIIPEDIYQGKVNLAFDQTSVSTISTEALNEGPNGNVNIERRLAKTGRPTSTWFKRFIFANIFMRRAPLQLKGILVDAHAVGGLHGALRYAPYPGHYTSINYNGIRIIGIEDNDHCSVMAAFNDHDEYEKMLGSLAQRDKLNQTYQDEMEPIIRAYNKTNVAPYLQDLPDSGRQNTQQANTIRIKRKSIHAEINNPDNCGQLWKIIAPQILAAAK